MTPENTTFLVAQALKDRKTRVLEGSSLAVGGGGRALVALRENTHLAAKVKFYLGCTYFSESGVGAGP